MARVSLLLTVPPQVLELQRIILSREGYEVIVASDGKKGVGLFRERPADLIITDLVMPEMDGTEIITRFRRDYPDVKNIAISGGGRNDSGIYLDLVENLGANCTFEKPFERKPFLAAVGNLLRTN